MNSIKIGIIFLFFAMSLIINIPLSFSMEYYVSNSGSDNNEGISLSKPWQTLTKINTFRFSPGDVVRFQRGSVWHQLLRPCSGSEKADLNRQNEFWYDDSSRVLKMYSKSNPAKMFKDVECALAKPVINVDNASYVILEGLQAAYGGADGIKGESTNHITIRDCDIYFVGGACQYGKIKNGQKVRFGNGIQFWNSARNNIVENCRIWEVYDTGISNQGRVSGNIQSNIIYRNNKIWNCEYSFEYWNDPETSTTQNIYFENNVCLNAGSGWSHNQRPDPSGRHLCFFTNKAKTTNIYIKNNTFDNAAQSCVWFCPSGRGGAPGFNGLGTLFIDYNSYYQPANRAVASWGIKIYYPKDFISYQQNTGKDAHSKIVIK